MNMKKLVAGVLCLGLATFALTGCGGKDNSGADQNQDQQQQQQEGGQAGAGTNFNQQQGEEFYDAEYRNVDDEKDNK